MEFLDASQQGGLIGSGPWLNENRMGDLVRQARKWRQRDGLKTKRDRLVSTLETMDAGGGAFEQRLLRANGDKSFAFTDSMAGFTTEQRSRTGTSLLDAHHMNGAKVSTAFHQQNGDPSRSGKEVLDDLLRSLPRAWVMP
jgi:hypothetical protein